ncbi:MAG: PD40 domain-containing protein [Gemmatimonadetes bacterium]|nr:PD40 domain-containing protein [Gemmatimonadota bacterium]
MTTILEVDAAAGERGLIWPDVLPDGETIIFSVVASEDADWEDRVDALNLTTTKRTTLAPGWQPRYADGHLLTGHSDGSVLARPIDIDRMTVGREARIAESVITRPDEVIEYAISATGTMVTMHGESEVTLIIASTDGPVEQLPVTGDIRGPRFSPDGARIAYQLSNIDASIWVYDIERRTQRRVVANGAYPAWTPGGDSILFLEADEVGWATERYHSIKKISVDGGTAETVYEGTIRGAIDVSRDGRWLAWPEAETDDPINRDLWYSSRDSSHVSRPFLESKGVDEYDIALSPNSRWALFTSEDQSPPGQSYLRAFPDGTNLAQLGPAGLTRWSPDGNAVFGSQASSGFLKVTVELGAQVRLIDRFHFGREWVHTGNGIDVHPDGLRIVAPANPASEAQHRFVIVVNALR